MEAPQIIGLRYKIGLNLTSRVQIMSLQNFQELVLIGCLTLNLRMEKVLIHQRRSQVVEGEVKSTLMSAFRGRIIALVVDRVVTK